MKKMILALLLLVSVCLVPTYAKEKWACSDEAACGELKPLSMEKALKKMEGHQEAYFYFGFESCPWCQQAKPILKSVIKKTGKTVYYVKIRNRKNELLVTAEQKKRYTPFLEKYMKPNNKDVLTLYVPLLVHYDGQKVVDGHQGTVKNHDASQRQMTKKERKTLRKVYTKILSE